METKKKSTGEKEAKKGRVKVGKLKLNKETVKDLTDSEAKKIKGGAAARTTCSIAESMIGCATTVRICA